MQKLGSSMHECFASSEVMRWLRRAVFILCLVEAIRPVSRLKTVLAAESIAHAEKHWITAVTD